MRQNFNKHPIINPTPFQGTPPHLEPMLHPHRDDMQIDAPLVAPNHPLIRQRAEGRALARIQSPGNPLCGMWHDEVCLDGVILITVDHGWRVVDGGQ
jgi:hypothetical protein